MPPCTLLTGPASDCWQSKVKPYWFITILRFYDFSTSGRGWVSEKLLSEVYLENKSGMYNKEISSFEFILKFWHSTFCISSRIFGSVTASKVAIIRTKIASFVFFSSLSFFFLALFFFFSFPFPFKLWSSAKNFWPSFTQMAANIVFKKSVRSWWIQFHFDKLLRFI